MRNALEGKPASMRQFARYAQTGITLVALFAFLTLSLGAARSVSAATLTGTGSVKITVVVSGGTARGSDFKQAISKKGSRSGNVTGSGDLVTFNVSPGTYVISQKAPSKYYATWSGDCNAKGEVVIAEGVQSNCTVTNSYGSKPPTGGGSTGGTTDPRAEGRMR